MVICNSMQMPMASSAVPMASAGILPLPPGMYPVAPLPTVSCNQRYPPPPTLISSGQVLQTVSTPITCIAGLPHPSSSFRSSLSSSPHSTNSTNTTPDASPGTSNGIILNGNASKYSPSSMPPYTPSYGITPGSPRYSPTTFFTPGLLTTAPPPVPCVPAIIQYNQPSSPQTTNPTETVPTPATSTVVVSNGSAVFTCTPVPTNIVPTILPINQTLIQCKVPSSQVNSAISNTVQCNQGLYTPNLAPSAIVPCSQRIVNGTSVLQCAPDVCQIAPAAVFSTAALEMCPVPSTPIAPNNSGIYSVSPPLLAQNICTATAAAPWKQSYGMEQVWQNEFRTLFLQYAPHVWMLLPVMQKPMGVWNANVDSAKVRFCCEDCGHGWTSMKGRVAFWFILNPVTNEGLVCLKLYGQQCDRCKTGNYEPAMWYPEEVVKVLVNIYNRVGQVYYGFQQAPYHKARRPGKPRTPHNSDLCQACKDGVCAERR